MNPKIIQYQKHIFFLLYILIGIVANYFHEPWRDETQAYLIAYDSQNLIDLYRNTRYEGHPMAWFLILFFVKLINSNYVLVKIVHFLIATASVYLLVFKSNINSLWKILIPFGYYFLFEYNIICRNYAIGILFLFLSLYHIQRKNWIYVAIFTIATFQSNVYILMISFVLWFTILSIHFRENKLKFSYLTAIIFLGLYFTYKTTFPPMDSGFATNTNFDCFNYLRTIDKLSQAYIVVPKLVINFWNSSQIGYKETTIVGVILLIFLVSYFKNFKKIYPFFLIASLSIFAFMNIKYWGFLRHYGHLYIIFIAAIWLKSIYYPDFKIRFSKFYFIVITDRKSTRLNSSHMPVSRMPSSA